MSYSIYEAVIALVGTPPAGYEVLVWVFSALVLFFLLRSVFGIINSLLTWVGGK